MKRRSPKERRELLRQFRRSGVSPHAFCRKHAIHYTTLYAWMRSEGRAKISKKFRRVKISPLLGLPLGQGFEGQVCESVVAEVAMANGSRVRLMRGCNEQELAMILEAVGASIGGG